jgi:hypothetical protein
MLPVRMEPYDLACENRTGFLGMITDGGHVVRTALQREDFVRIVLAGRQGETGKNRGLRG